MKYQSVYRENSQTVKLSSRGCTEYWQDGRTGVVEPFVLLWADDRRRPCRADHAVPLRPVAKAAGNGRDVVAGVLFMLSGLLLAAWLGVRGQ
jgi:hypothetical protein